MKRSASFRVAGDLDDDVFVGAVQRITGLAGELSAAVVDVYINVTDEAPETDEHPERDELLALVDSWRDKADSGQYGPAAPYLRQCADDLLATLAHLSL